METTEDQKNGLFLSDLIELAKKNGVKPENLCLSLCVDEIEPHTTRIAKVVTEVESHDEYGQTGIMWLHLDPKIEKIVNKSFDELEWESMK